MRLADVIRLASKITVARITERDDFSERLRAGQPVGLHELLYPLMQAYDSVAIRADLELGATEQKFNLLAGRTLQAEYGQEPQLVMTLPILPGIDGVRRMSKSLGNYIGIAETPREMYGKIMSIPDETIVQYLRLATDLSAEEVGTAEKELAGRAVNPVVWKRKLAERVVTMYHGADEAARAAEEFTRQFARHEIPEDAPTITLSWPEASVGLKDLLTRTSLASSGADALRLIQGGAVSIDGERRTDKFYRQSLEKEFHLRVGRKYLKVLPERISTTTPGGA